MKNMFKYLHTINNFAYNPEPIYKRIDWEAVDADGDVSQIYLDSTEELEEGLNLDEI